MSAATKPRRTPFRSSNKPPVVGYVQKAGTVLYKGCAVGHVAGVFQPVASGVAGLVFCGFAAETYDCSTEGADYTWPSNTPIVCRRDVFALDGKSGDAPTAASLNAKAAAVGTPVYLDDDQTVKVTQVSNDVVVNLVEIEGTRYWVEP